MSASEVRKPIERHAHHPFSVTRFRPDIEGLRAVAVTLVLLYHAAVPGFEGGYIGVDVFLALSGFLVTGLLIDQLQAVERISLRAFYARRIRRLLPVSAVVFVCILVAARFFLTPLEMRDLRTDAFATAGYVSNYWFAAGQTDYLQSHRDASPFQHFWSLAIEEQFYVVWPLLLVGAARLARWRKSPLAAIGAVLGSLTLVSMVASVVVTSLAEPWAFFSLPTRAWELGAGGLLAVAVRARPSAISIRAKRLAIWLGVGLLAYALTTMDATTAFPGAWAGLPVVGTLCFIIGGYGGCASRISFWLSARPFRAVGRWSYSLYLWHWPFLLFTRGAPGGDLSWSGRIAVLAVTTVLAAATFRWIETPVRHAKSLTMPMWRSYALAAVITVVMIAAAVVMTFPGPLAVEYRAQGLGTVIDPATDATPVAPSNLRPSLLEAMQDLPDVYTDGCHRDFLDVTVDGCAYGPALSPTVVLFGDSHAAQWFPALRQLTADQGLRLLSFTKSGCPSATISKWSTHLGRRYVECDEWRQNVIERIRQEAPALVVLANGTSEPYRSPDGGATGVPQDEWLDGIEYTAGTLEKVAPVAVIADSPFPGFNVPSCLSDHLADAHLCALNAVESLSRTFKRKEAEAVQRAGAIVVDVLNYLCTEEECPAVLGDTLVYYDDSHLTPRIVMAMVPVLRREFGAVLHHANTDRTMVPGLSS